MEKVWHFKVFLARELGEDSENPEIRRFEMRTEVGTKLNYLEFRKKLLSLFSNLEGERFTITWQDVDGDYVAISSTEELHIAMMETQDMAVHKLFIKKLLPVNSESEKSTFTATRVNFQPSGPKVQHYGVECDGCEGAIVGFRYKCLQCPDYDLCQECEMKCLHPEHCMLRISVPRQWKTHYAKKLSHQLNKFMKKGVSPDEAPKDCPYKLRKSTNSQRRCDQPSWFDVVSTYLNDWANLPGECPGMDQAKKSSQSGKDEATSSKHNLNKKMSPDTHIEFLKNIGENIAQFLDPLGIDVSVAVKSPNDKNTADAGSSKKTESTKKDNEDQTPSKSNVPQSNGSIPTVTKQSQPMKQNIPTSNENCTPSAPEMGEKNNIDENDEWTFICDDDSTSSTGSSCAQTKTAPQGTTQNAPTTESNNGKVPITSNPTNIYPVLNPNISDNIWHPNPKIQRAVESMMQMGFTNEGGWLTQLLISKDGDISKVLDLLQPTYK